LKPYGTADKYSGHAGKNGDKGKIQWTLASFSANTLQGDKET